MSRKKIKRAPRGGYLKIAAINLPSSGHFSNLQASLEFHVFHDNAVIYVTLIYVCCTLLNWTRVPVFPKTIINSANWRYYLWNVLAVKLYILTVSLSQWHQKHFHSLSDKISRTRRRHFIISPFRSPFLTTALSHRISNNFDECRFSLWLRFRKPNSEILCFNINVYCYKLLCPSYCFYQILRSKNRKLKTLYNAHCTIYCYPYETNTI